MSRSRFAALVAAVSLLMAAEQCAARDALKLCREKGTDDTLRPLPLSLVSATKRLFGLGRMPNQQVRHSTVFRCADGRVLLCNYGANLPCGKASADRQISGTDAWCRDHPDADFIPRFAIPPGNIYNWRCAAGAPQILAQVEEIDARGFVSRYWKPAD